MKEHKCDVCGRLSRHKIKSQGYILCSKHYNQLKKYKTFLDNNPRTLVDPNEIRVKNGIAYMDLYNKKCEVVATTKFDVEDIYKVKKFKWRLTAFGYVYQDSKKGGTRHLSRYILDTEKFVDHINHDILDNRKSNLREVTKSQNQMNVDYKGYYPKTLTDGTIKWQSKIKLKGKVFCLGIYADEEEAAFSRWYAERVLFKEYAYPKQKPKILKQREKQIIDYVNRKVQRA